MIINTGWLLDYLSPRVPLPDLLTALPRVGLDVEATHVLERDLAPVRVGFIRSKRPLDGPPIMFVCEVEVARGDVRRIVCASAHPLEEGWGFRSRWPEPSCPLAIRFTKNISRGLVAGHDLPGRRTGD